MTQESEASPAPESVSTANNEMPAATLSGVISRHIGGPLGGATVKCGEKETSSDKTGTFVLKVPLKERTKLAVTISAQGFLAETRDIDLSPGEELSLDVVLGKGRTGIEGIVSDKRSGASLAGAYVSIETQRTYADQQGHFVFNDLDALKTYPVTVYHDGYESKIFLSKMTENGKTLECNVQLDKKKEALQQTDSVNEEQQLGSELQGPEGALA